MEADWQKAIDLRSKTGMGRPHLVVLGAGASRAAFPNGDRHGRLLPVLSELSEAAGLDELFEHFGVSAPRSNFEEVFSDLCSSPEARELVAAVERRVREYFASLDLPSQVTLYDQLVLSLREKDYIATFNWDPFLFAALERNTRVVPGPTGLFLHGFAAGGVCEDDKTVGWWGDNCRHCGRGFQQTRLLYPVKDKDYKSDKLVSSDWKAFAVALRESLAITIFGYSAPRTDAAAVDAMMTALGESPVKELREVEIIDIADPAILEERWAPFFVGTHYGIWSRFEQSTIARWPRRSCEALWAMHMALQQPVEDRAPEFASLEEAQRWFGELAAYEK